MNKLTLKLIIWHVVVLILALIFWGYGSRVSSDILFGKSFDGSAVLYLVLLLTAVVMGIALFQKKIWALTLNGVVGTIYLFQFGFSDLNLLGTAILLVFGLHSLANSKSEITQRTKINMRRIIQYGSWPVIMGLFILVSFAAYQSPAIQKLKNANRLPSQSEVFIQSLVETTIGSRIDTNNPSEKRNIINQITSETVREINNLVRPYLKYTPPVLAFGLFLILWGLSWIFVWLSVLLGMLIFWILKKTKFVKIEKYSVEAEKLTV